VLEYALVALILLTPVAGLLLLRRTNAFVVAEQVAIVRVRRRLARERRPPVSDRLGRRTALRRLDDVRDLRRLLLRAGEDTTPGVWALRVLAIMLAVLAGLTLLNVASVLGGNGVAVPWIGVVLLLAAVPLTAVLLLRLRAARHQENAGRAFAEVAAVLAGVGGRPPLRNPAQLEPTDLVALVAAWTDDPALRAIVDGNRWRRLADDAGRVPATESEWFQIVGELYEIPAATRVAEVVRVSRELSPGDVAARYLLTARDLTKERLANLRARNRRAMVTQVVPMLGLVAALMILVLSAVAAINLGGS
jgi:hypothetical protein